jgi:hypothetical protein
MGKPVTRVSVTRVTGPLAPYAEVLKADLEARGYTPLSAARLMRVVTSLSRWLEAENIVAADLNGDRIDRFIDARRAAGYVAQQPRRVLMRMIETLGAIGVVQMEQPAAPCSAIDVLLVSFRTYLDKERCLTASTTAAYVNHARRFLLATEGRALGELEARDVTEAVLRESATGELGSVLRVWAALVPAVLLLRRAPAEGPVRGCVGSHGPPPLDAAEGHRPSGNRRPAQVLRPATVRGPKRLRDLARADPPRPSRKRGRSDGAR